MTEINNKTRKKIDNKIIKDVVEKFFKKYRLNSKEVSIAFIGDKKMKDLNHLYRKKNKTTDVLSFAGEGDFLGEILINPNQIKKQAQENGNNFKKELVFILVHGLLHLIGYDDTTEKDRLQMIKLGESFIKSIK